MKKLILLLLCAIACNIQAQENFKELKHFLEEIVKKKFGLGLDH